MSGPFRNESHQAIGQMSEVREVTDLKSFALQDAEALLDLIHPGAMGRQEMADKPGMSGQPVLRLLAIMHAGVIEYQEDAADCSGKLFLHWGEQSDELFLPLAHSCLSCDLARPCSKGRKQVDGSGAFVLVLHAGRQSWERRFGRGQARARLQIGLLVQAENPLPRGKRTCVEINELMDLLGEVLITRHLWGKPQVRAPGSELVGLQDPANCLTSAAGSDAIRLELTSQVGAVPLREGTSEVIGPFTGQFDHVESHLGSKDRRTTRARLLTQTRHALFAKAPRPFAQMAFAQANLSSCGNHALPSFKQQESTGPSH